MKKKLNKLLIKVYEFFESNKKILIYSILMSIFIGIFVLNMNTPYTADDYTYRYIYNTNEKVNGVYDIFYSQYIHYFTWGGRSIVHSLVQFFMMLDKNVFNVCNSFAYIVFIILLYMHCTGKRKLSFKLLIIINFLVWIFEPAFGESILWLTGSCNYLWGCILILLFLLPYRRILAEDNKDISSGKQIIHNIIMFLLGILAGWTNENSAAAMLFMAILFIIITKINKIKVKKWQIFGLLGAIIGYFVMIIAPGNYIRDSSGHGLDIIQFIKLLISRGIEITKTADILLNYLVIILLIAAILYIKFGNKRIKNHVYCVYILGALVGIYIMIMAPFFPRRAYFGVVCFIIIAIGIFLDNVEIKNMISKNIAMVILTVIIIFSAYRYYNVLNEAVNINMQVENRISEIKKQKEQGVLNVEINTGRIIVNNYDNYIHYEDCYECESNWINKATALFYGIDTIKVK